MPFREGLELLELAHEPAQILADALEQLLERVLAQGELAPPDLIGHVAARRSSLQRLRGMRLRALQQLLPDRLPLVGLARHEDEARVRAGVLEIRGQLVAFALDPVRRAHHDRPPRGEQGARPGRFQHAAPARLVAAQDPDRILAVAAHPAREQLLEDLLREVRVHADDGMDSGGGRGRSLRGRR
jgi:hypothetical protein